MENKKMKKTFQEIESSATLEKITNDLIQSMFVETRGIWVIPGSLSVLLCDALEGVFVLLAGSPEERNTKATIDIIEKLGYEVERNSVPHDDESMDLREVLPQIFPEEEAYLERMLHAENRLIDIFMQSDEEQRRDVIRTFRQHFESLRDDATRAEVERARRFLLMLTTVVGEMEKRSITSFAFGGNL